MNDRLKLDFVKYINYILGNRTIRNANDVHSFWNC